MQNIIFSKLGEHDTYYKVESVHLQDKMFGIQINSNYRMGNVMGWQNVNYKTHYII
jgi:hypothetical protein